ncbi:uncharacterized protein LOC108043808 [Drosophila rhopaloa]|uniref:Uncharacterized protein LOC108043808 n=1 Tax=Drosophila rhopaloa TaxID=1041015 RepID=A0A6P4ESQ0_DRORH|nr:uncharacterized protein LOC108043808 [Drosophila rhopaloa]
MIYRRLFLLILLIWLTITLNSILAQRMEAYMTKIECPNHFPELIKNLSCHLNPSSQHSGSSEYSAEFVLTKDVTNVKGIYVFSLKRGSIITNYTAMEIDYCQALASLQSHFLLKMIADELRRVANFPLQCPFKMNKRYYVNNFSINSKLIPSYAPELNFISDCNIFVNNRKALTLIIHGRVVRRRSGR